MQCLVISWYMISRGSRKSTPFAAQMASEAAAKSAQEHGLKSVEGVTVKVRFWSAEPAIRALAAAGGLSNSLIH